MSWRCPQCGERHGDEFDSCWRCSPPPDESEPDLEAYLADDEDENLVPQLTPEQEAAERAALDRRAAEIVEEQGGLFATREARAAAGIARLQKAYALYRLRQEPTRFAPPTGEARKLNQQWNLLMWSGGIVTGLALLFAFKPDRLFPFYGDWLIYAFLGLMVFTVMFASHVADREIKLSEGPDSPFQARNANGAERG